MTDNLAIGLTHFLLLLAAWRLLKRRDLDQEPGPGESARAGIRIAPIVGPRARGSFPGSFGGRFAPGAPGEGDSRSA